MLFRSADIFVSYFRHTFQRFFLSTFTPLIFPNWGADSSNSNPEFGDNNHISTQVWYIKYVYLCSINIIYAGHKWINFIYTFTAPLNRGRVQIEDNVSASGHVWNPRYRGFSFLPLPFPFSPFSRFLLIVCYSQEFV